LGKVAEEKVWKIQGKIQATGSGGHKFREVKKE
jgi:hypothetical protein